MLTVFDIIFNKGYLVRIPGHLLDAYNEEDHGRHTTGDANIDRAVGTEGRTVAWTPNQMIEGYQAGLPILILNQDDVREIYNAVEQHLVNIREYTLDKTGSLNKRKINTEDIKVMDEFTRMLSVKYPGIIERDNAKEHNNNRNRSLYSVLMEDIDPDLPSGSSKVDVSELLKDS